MTSDPLAEARQALDRALAARPRLDGHALTEATKALCRRRDDLRVRLRDGAGGDVRRELKALNATISLVHAGHFPLAAIPWTLLEQARHTLDVAPVAKA